MKLTISNRLKLCFEILTIRSGHGHTAQEKILSTFLKGYRAGMEDGKICVKPERSCGGPGFKANWMLCHEWGCSHCELYSGR